LPRNNPIEMKTTKKSEEDSFWINYNSNIYVTIYFQNEPISVAAKNPQNMKKKNLVKKHTKLSPLAKINQTFVLFALSWHIKNLTKSSITISNIFKETVLLFKVDFRIIKLDTFVLQGNLYLHFLLFRAIFRRI
jgi:hypothetical protein